MSGEAEPGQIASVDGSISDTGEPVASVMHSVEYSYSGPLPHPEILRRYNEIIPGSAERIFSQFESQSAHRRALEMKVIASNTFSQRFGSISALLIGLVSISGGLFLVHEGKSLEGLGAVITPVAGLVAAYIYKRRSQDDEREAKRET